MSKAYYFSDEDVAVLKRILADVRNRPQNTSNRPSFEGQSQAPEVYVALTPDAGIPAFSSSPAGAVCQVYRLLTDESPVPLLEVAGATRTVYNLGSSDVAGGTFILIERDKYGTWFAVTAGVGGQECFPAIITGGLGRGRYEWVRVSPAPNATWAFCSEEGQGVEMTNNPDVPLGVIVLMCPAALCPPTTPPPTTTTGAGTTGAPPTTTTIAPPCPTTTMAPTTPPPTTLGPTTSPPTTTTTAPDVWVFSYCCGNPHTGGGTTSAGPTTTLTPCVGTCQWNWSSLTRVWVLFCTGCDPSVHGCVCQEPGFCGTVDGETTRTFCAHGSPPPPCCDTGGPTTTGSGTTASGTTTAGGTTTTSAATTVPFVPGCSGCCYVFDAITGSWGCVQQDCPSGGNCPDGCGCCCTYPHCCGCDTPALPPTAGDCQLMTVGCLGCPSTTCFPSACTGVCQWRWFETIVANPDCSGATVTGGGWELIQETCSSCGPDSPFCILVCPGDCGTCFTAPCICDAPSFQGTCHQVVNSPCYTPVVTTGPTTGEGTTTASGTTASPTTSGPTTHVPCVTTTCDPNSATCCGSCLWQGDGSGGWVQLSTSCSVNCGCPKPPFASQGTSEVAQTACTVPVTTTTTLAPCAGEQCCWQCQFPGVWINITGCPPGDQCLFDQTLNVCDAEHIGDTATGICQPPPPTTTTICPGVCQYLCNFGTLQFVFSQCVSPCGCQDANILGVYCDPSLSYLVTIQCCNQAVQSGCHTTSFHPTTTTTTTTHSPCFGTPDCLCCWQCQAGHWVMLKNCTGACSVDNCGLKPGPCSPNGSLSYTNCL